MKQGLNQIASLIWPLVLLAVLPMVLVTGQARADGRVKTEIRLDPSDIVGLDELTILEIKILVAADDVPSIPDPVFELENFRKIEGPSQSTGLTTVQGRQLASRILTWKLRPWRTGRARVFAARVTIEGQTIEIGERRIEVVRNPPPGRRRSPSGEDPLDQLHSFDPSRPLPEAPPRSSRRSGTGSVPRIILRAETVPSRPYVGQQTLYTLNLYTQVDISSVNPDEFPDFKGFWARVIPQPAQKPKMVRFDGESFGRVILIQRALFPRRAGNLQVEPITARMLAELPETGLYGSSLPKAREIVRQSNAARIEVRELPPPPIGFHGAVGMMELEVELVPQQLEIGEAATLTLKLHGRAHLQGIQAPTLPDFADIRVFPPQQQSEEGLRGSNVYSSRTWSYVLVPEKVGEYQMPTIEVPYFDPQKQRYLVAASTPLALTVRDAGQPQVDQAELRPIHTAEAESDQPGSMLTRHLPWLIVFPWLIAGAALLWQRRTEKGGAHTDRRHLLERLDRAAAEEKPRQAAAKIEEAWREYLFQRWQIPESSPSTQWSGLLAERGADRQKASSLVQLADDLHYLRYAPKLSSISELREELLERSRKLARSMG